MMKSLNKNNSVNRLIVIWGLIVSLITFFVVLLFSYSVKSWSDPAHWYTFGLTFPDSYFVSRLAYGFPLILYIASKIVGAFYAFLVNIPILVLLIGIYYLFNKTVFINSGWSYTKKAVSSFLAMSMIMLFNHEMLIVILSNPYRDPVAFIFMLLSLILVIKYVHSSFRSHYLMSLAGFMLAFAVSCRETTGLIIIPIFIYLISNWYKNYKTPYIKDSIRFCLFLTLGMLPWLLQNYYISGNPLIPSQALDNVVRTSSVVAIIPHGHWVIVPRTLLYMFKHNGIALSIISVVGLFFSFKQKNLELIYICFGGALTFLLFYFTYPKIMPRYLMVIDWFSIPLAIYGISNICSLVTGRYNISISGNKIFVLSVVLLLVFIVFPLERTTSRVRISDMRQFKHDVGSIMNSGAVVFIESESSIYGLFRCFSSASPRYIVRWPFITKGLVCYTSLSPATMALLKSQDNIRVLDRWSWVHDLYINDKPLYAALEKGDARNYLGREYDFIKDSEIFTDRYNINKKPYPESFILSELKLWQRHTNVVAMVTNSILDSKIIVMADFKHLSRYKRKSAIVHVNGKVVDEAPLDNINYYLIDSMPSGSVVNVSVSSDGLLPNSFNVSLQPANRSIVINVNGSNIIFHRDRFLYDFFNRKRPRYPEGKNGGKILLPSLNREGLGVMVTMNVALDVATDLENLTITAGQKNIEVLKNYVLEGHEWQYISFVIPSEAVDGINTEINLHFSNTDTGIIYIRQITVTRIE